MPDDIPLYMLILFYTSLIGAAILTTAFPIAYSLFPWWRSITGRALMTKSIAFAVIVDATVIFHFWQVQNIMFALWVNIALFTFLGYGSARTLHMLRKRGDQINPKVTEKQDA